MIPGAIPINAPRTVPSSPSQAPAVASINPDGVTEQQRSQIPRAVNRSERVENPALDQSRPSTNLSSNEQIALDPAEQRVLNQLQARDREVRAHEQAHLSAAGNLATSGASFTYQRGPDGQRYAVGGEVGIDGARVAGDPEATIQRAQQIRRAALAPASPSAQDRSVAANASATEQKATVELAKQVQEERGQSAVGVFNDIAASGNEDQDDENRPDSVTAPIDTFA